MSLYTGTSATPPLARKSGRYTCLATLGKGTYGTCYKVLLQGMPENIEPCVMKVIPLSQLKTCDVHAAFSEAILLSQIHHPHVVGYLDAWVENTHLYIVMAYCDQGDLAARLRSRQLSMSEVLQFARDSAAGLQHLHGHQIMHRDVKPSNLFIHEDRLIIGDLGLGKRMEQMSVANTRKVGTPLYFSPEVCREQPYAYPSDVWAFGCVLYEMLSGTPPFVATTQTALSEKICLGAPPILPAICPPPLTQIIMGALQKLPERRPTMLQCFHMVSNLCSASQVSTRLELAPVGSYNHTRVCEKSNHEQPMQNKQPNQTADNKPIIALSGDPKITHPGSHNLQSQSILTVLHPLQSENSSLKHRLDINQYHPTAATPAPTSNKLDAPTVFPCSTVHSTVPPCANSGAVPSLQPPLATFMPPPMHRPSHASFQPSGTFNDNQASDSQIIVPPAHQLPAAFFSDPTVYPPSVEQSETEPATCCPPSSTHLLAAQQLVLPVSARPLQNPAVTPAQMHFPSTFMHLPISTQSCNSANANNTAAPAMGSTFTAHQCPNIAAQGHAAAVAGAGVPGQQVWATVCNFPSPFVTSALPEAAAASNCTADMPVAVAPATEPVGEAKGSTLGAGVVHCLPPVVSHTVNIAFDAVTGYSAGDTTDPSSLPVPPSESHCLFSLEQGTTREPHVTQNEISLTPNGVYCTTLVASATEGSTVAGCDNTANKQNRAAIKNIVKPAQLRENDKPSEASIPADLRPAEGCLRCEEAVRCVDTLKIKVAALESVLASTKQRAATDRHALELLRAEYTELEECLRKGGNLTLSPGMSILKNPPLAPLSTTGTTSQAPDAVTGDISDSIPAYVPEMHATHVCSSSAAHHSDDDKVLPVHQLTVKQEEHSAGGPDSNCGHTTATHEPETVLQTPIQTPQLLHKRAYVNTPADLRKLLQCSLQASRVPEHSVAASRLTVGAMNSGYRSTAFGVKMMNHNATTNSSESHDSMHCQRPITARSTSDTGVVTALLSAHAFTDKANPFQIGGATGQKPSLCDSLCMHELHAFVVNDRSADKNGAIPGTYNRMHGRFADSEESPNLSPAACVLQAHPERMHGLHVSSSLQHSCGEWFGSRSSGSSSRLGILGPMQLHGRSVVRGSMHALDACNLENAGDHETSGAMYSIHRALHAANDAAHSQKPPNDGAVPIEAQQHASDMEQATLLVHVAQQQKTNISHSPTRQAASLTSYQPDAHAPFTEQITSGAETAGASARSENSPQGALLDTIADMRKTLAEDCGASPPPPAVQRTSAQQPRDSEVPVHQSQPDQVLSVHTMHVQQKEASNTHAVNTHETPKDPFTHINSPEQDQAQAQDRSSSIQEAVTVNASSAARGSSEQAHVPPASHVLVRCQGTSYFTPSPHPKQKRKPAVAPRQEFQPFSQDSIMNETPEATPVKSCPENTTTAATAASFMSTSDHTQQLGANREQTGGETLCFQRSMAACNTYEVGGFLTPQQPARMGSSKYYNLKLPNMCSNTCSKMHAQHARWTECTSTYSHNLSATPPRTRPSGMGGSVAAAISPRPKPFSTPQPKRSESDFSSSWSTKLPTQIRRSHCGLQGLLDMRT